MPDFGEQSNRVCSLKNEQPLKPDYTPQERKIIKELVKEARRRNTNEAKEEYLWKVREIQIVNIYTSRA